jgi:DNA-directed RNA polymerase subunit N (RpoN/RPB10)
MMRLIKLEGTLTTYGGLDWLGFGHVGHTRPKELDVYVAIATDGCIVGAVEAEGGDLYTIEVLPHSSFKVVVRSMIKSLKAYHKSLCVHHTDTYGKKELLEEILEELGFERYGCERWGWSVSE